MSDSEDKRDRESGNRRITGLLILFCILASLVPLCYTLYTHHIWEDFFITFRCSRNLAEGNGLVYEAGKRVHVFTSPLGVLLPALCYLLTGSSSYESALWLFRILFCIPAFVLGGVFVVRTIYSEYRDKSILPVAAAAAFYLLDVKAVMFSVNGMETAFMLFFFAAALYFLCTDFKGKWMMSGLAWGGLMWTRPDSCIYIGVIMITAVLFSGNRKGAVTAVLKASGITTVIYFPWFAGAWLYYGSPVPNTVLAKGAVSIFSPAVILTRLPYHISWAFEPVYASDGWPASVHIFALTLAFFCFIYWVLPLKDKFGRRLSFMFFLLSFYFAFMTYPYPWYYPPFTMLGSIILVNGLWKIFNGTGKYRVWGPIFLIPITVYMLFLFGMVSYQMKMQQQLIETGLRRPIGLWLKDHVRPGEKVYLECLGYIGYFSGAEMLDYPGLATPESVKAIAEKGCTMTTLINELKPAWVILRPGEAEEALKYNFFVRDYRYVCHLSALNRIKKAGFIPGYGYLYHDATFAVYKRASTRKK